MSRALVVDDEPLARTRLAALLRECEGVEVVGALADGEHALGATRELQPDIVLLDINMPGLDGMSVAQRWAGKGRPQVIFCTAYDTHALEAFELDAVDYLLKPVRLDRLRTALVRAQRRLAEAVDEPMVYLRGRLGSEEIRVLLDDVICLLAEEKYVVVRHLHGELLIEESLRQLEEAYPQLLVRLHRNCLVPPARLLGLKTQADGRVLARLDGTDFAPEVSRRNLAVVRRLLRL